MPTYDYRCTKCGKEFEVFHKISETPKILCPECSAAAEKMISSSSNFILKGDGFYVNDYKKKEPKTEHKCDTCPHKDN